MISANEARNKSVGTNNSTAQIVLRTIETSINNAVEAGSTAIKLGMANDLSTNVKEAVLHSLAGLGYKASFDSFTPPQWDGGKTEYYINVSWK